MLVALALVGGTAQAPAYSNTNVCFLVADGGNLLSRFDRSTDVETLVGGLGVSNVEADAFWPGTDVLYGADAATLGTINLTSGAYTSIGSFGSATSGATTITINDVDGLTFDPFTGILYGSHRRSGSPDLLVQINPSTGAVVNDAFGFNTDFVVIPSVAGLLDVDDIAVDPFDGQMYATLNNGGGDHLIAVDKATGASSDVGLMSESDMEGMGWYNDGTLYGTTGTSNGANSNMFWDINKATGVATNGRALSAGTDYEGADCLVGDPNTITGTVFEDVDMSGRWPQSRNPAAVWSLRSGSSTRGSRPSR